MLGNWSDSLDHLIHLLVAFVLALPIGWNRARAEQGAGLRTLDRKSTRLNSSHSQISYAVFCLKKKHAVHGDPHLIAERTPGPLHQGIGADNRMAGRPVVTVIRVRFRQTAMVDAALKEVAINLQ